MIEVQATVRSLTAGKKIGVELAEFLQQGAEQRERKHRVLCTSAVEEHENKNQMVECWGGVEIPFPSYVVGTLRE